MRNSPKGDKIRDIVKSVRMTNEAYKSLLSHARDLDIPESKIMTQILERIASEMDKHRKRGEIVREFFDRHFPKSSDNK